MNTKIFTKIALVILFTISFSFLTFGQTPEMFKYQAVLRDASGNILANQSKTVVIDILKTSPNGTSVFTESQSVTTTAQGLINLNIGSINDLSGIDWTADEYFIQITVDGTIMGTSQLLSVPYALQAKEVENVDYSQITGTPNLSNFLTIETDPIFTAWDKDYADLTNTPNLSNFLTSETDPIFTAWDKDYADLINKPVNATTTTDGLMSSADKTKLDGLTNADGSETKLTAGTNITITGSGTTASPYVINATSSEPTYTVGLNTDLGGYVFYVTPDGKHGLVAATQNQSTSCTWYNAQDVISNPANHNTAGKKFTDWRLPTKYELNLMYAQRVAITGFTANWYWCSTETYYANAWVQGFSDGSQYDSDKTYTYYVRAVRAF